MLLLNTRFNVSKDFDRLEFVKLIKNWLNQSQYLDITIDDFNFESDVDYQNSAADGSCKIVINNYEKCFIFQFINNDEGSIFDTIYVLRDKDENPSLFVQQNHSYETYVFGARDPELKVPNLLKNIFWDEYGDMDQNLMTDNKALVLRKSDIKLATSIINHEMNYMNPVVYVSPSQNGHYEVNYDFLAQELMGQAHIVVEGSPKVAQTVREITDERNPFNGAVTVYFPGNHETRILPKGKGFNYDIIKTVRRSLARIEAPEDVNPIKIRQSHNLERIKNSTDSEFVELCEEMLAEKDTEIAAMKRELNAMKQELSASKAKSASLQDGLERSEESSPNGISFDMNEKDLYPNERKDIILKILQREYDMIKDDANAGTSRKADVLRDVVEHNFPSGTDTELIETIKRVLKDGTLSKEGIGCLQDIGFGVGKTGSDHYKMIFGDDDRYSFICANTPSDNRGAKNLVSSISNTLFGF